MVGEIIPFMEVRYWLLVTLKKSDVNIFYRWVASASFHIYYAWTSGDKVVHWSRHGNSLFPIEISRKLSRIGVLKYERSDCFKLAIRDIFRDFLKFFVEIKTGMAFFLCSQLFEPFVEPPTVFHNQK